MPEGGAPTGSLALLQRTVTDLVLTADASPFREEPAAFAAARGLALRDQQALATRRDRWLVYRDLARTALTDSLPDTFPITQALLEAAGAWTEAEEAFLASRTVSSPYYRDIAPAFVAWLVASQWGHDRWPFLLQLAHYEALELDVLRHPDEPLPPGLFPEPAANRVAVLDGATRHVAYSHAVQEATVASPMPRPASARLLCHRDATGTFRVLELTPHASALLARSQEGQTVGEAIQDLSVDLAEAFALLCDFRDRGALLGFRPR